MAITSFPEFGVNGIAFSNDGSELYMANMSTDVIYKMGVRGCGSGCQPSSLRQFVRGQGINGPDNIAFDENGLLWVASGQNDRVVAINPRGQVVARVGAFEGFSRGGAPIGLLQPSGIAVVGDRVYVGNESSRGLRPHRIYCPRTSGISSGSSRFPKSERRWSCSGKDRHQNANSVRSMTPFMSLGFAVCVS